MAQPFIIVNAHLIIPPCPPPGASCKTKSRTAIGVRVYAGDIKIAREKRAAYQLLGLLGQARPQPRAGRRAARRAASSHRPRPWRSRRESYGPHVHGRPERRLPFPRHARDGFRQSTQPPAMPPTAYELIDAAITAVAHCAPPDNKPLPHEINHCAAFLNRTIDTMSHIQAGAGGIVVLGRLAFDAALRLYRQRARWLPSTSSQAHVRPWRGSLMAQRPLPALHFSPQPAISTLPAGLPAR